MVFWGELEKQAEKTHAKKLNPRNMLPIAQKLRYNPENLAQYSQIVSNYHVKFATKYFHLNGFYNGFDQKT